ncbi:MAG: type II toxin-antitoxin system MqsA family antitoxin [Chloroflexota bacterium]
MGKYGDCFYCGGIVEEQLTAREIRWHGQLYVFEDVPAGVCVQCGERYILPEVAKSIDRVLADKRVPTRTLLAPVYEYKLETA